MDGDFFGGQVLVRHVTMSRQKDAQVAGDISMRRVDVGTLARALRRSRPKARRPSRSEES